MNKPKNSQEFGRDRNGGEYPYKPEGSSERKNSRGLGRREFLKWGLGGLGALGVAQFLGCGGMLNSKSPTIPGEIKGANFEIGHLLREAVRAEVVDHKQYEVVIIGGGVAGLSAAWELQRQGITDFVILELEEKTGGNAMSGGHGNHRYPWGAHYLPLPNLSNQDLLQLLEDLECILGYEGDLPIYEELYLCHAPQERLLIHGLWQEGLIPKTGNSPEDNQEIDRFFSFIETLELKRGSDDKLLFDIPLDQSSQDPDWLALDQISFAEWLTRQEYTSERLLWYLDYCCRDDFGGKLKDTSAWAGLHYFSSRQGVAANAPSNSVLTWPEGNGWLTQQMTERLKDKVVPNSLVYQIEIGSDDSFPVTLKALDTLGKTVTEYQAQKVIYAGPQFIRKYLLPQHTPDLQRFSYGPWAVANVQVKQRPTGMGRPLSWDNVAYESDSLGYIVSDHQSLTLQKETVLTWYKALVDQSPKQEREAALERSYEDWQKMVLADLESMHSEIREQIEQIDVWIWGHGMIRPEPGFITSPERMQAQQPVGPIHFAHSDLSGISIFEEAFAQGVRAAREILPGSKQNDFSEVGRKKVGIHPSKGLENSSSSDQKGGTT